MTRKYQRFSKVLMYVVRQLKNVLRRYSLQGDPIISLYLTNCGDLPQVLPGTLGGLYTVCGWCILFNPTVHPETDFHKPPKSLESPLPH